MKLCGFAKVRGYHFVICNRTPEAIDTIQRLPDSADTEEMMCRLYVLENVRRGQLDIDNGNTESTEELLLKIKTW